MLPKLIIFDFDGTLADTRRSILETYRRTVAALGLDNRTDAEFQATIGIPLRDGFGQLYPDASAEELDLYTATYRRIYNENKDEMVPELFEGVADTLDKLKRLGIQLTIASSRSRVSLVEFCRDKGIEDYFAVILGADDVTLAKPNPEPVLKTLAALNRDAEQTIVVGDMPVDIAMGAGAGCRTVGVTYGNASRKELVKQGADYIIDTFPALLSHVIFESE